MVFLALLLGLCDIFSSSKKIDEHIVPLRSITFIILCVLHRKDNSRPPERAKEKHGNLSVPKTANPHHVDAFFVVNGQFHECNGVIYKYES
jgi:hypothetical protein